MKDKIIKLLCDNREKKSRLKYVTQNYEKYKPTIQTLKYGDYHYLTEKGKRVVWEYKTGKDFINSIDNSHLHNQVYEMCTHYDYTFIIIVVSDWDYMIQSYYINTGLTITKEKIFGAIARFNTYTTVIQVSSQEDAFDIMERQTKKIIEKKPLCRKFKKKNRNYAINRLNCIHGLGVDKAELIATNLQLQTEKDLLNLTVDDLTTVPKIGERTAQKIIANLREA